MLYAFILIQCGFVSFREDTDKKRERRERVRQWQEKMNKEEPSSLKNQQANRSRPKKKAPKPAGGDKRRSNDIQREGDRDLHRRLVNKARFENDDYFEIPMDVESDSTGQDWIGDVTKK